MENENCVGARVREVVTSRSVKGGVRVEALQHEIDVVVDGGREVVVLQSVQVSVRRGDEEHFTASLTVSEAERLFEALAELVHGQAERVFSEAERRGSQGDGAMAGAESAREEVDGLPVHPCLVRKVDDWGFVEGLDEDELADPFELERCAIRGYWPWWMFKLKGGVKSPGEPWFPD
ncbi:MAG: hypothetical protein M5U21_13425 [Fimbriimonadaceae bacterium]|nr:hypothetical protein [Fimbriimonadaceae bacterium]